MITKLLLLSCLKDSTISISIFCMMLLANLPTDFTTVLGLVMVVLCTWLLLRRPANRPPHPLSPSPPYQAPFIGHLYLLGKDPREKFRKWRQRYGDIFSLRLVSHTVVVISGYQLLHDAFIKFADVFSHSTDLYQPIQTGKKRGIALPSGEALREQRKAGLDILHELGSGNNILAVKIQDEVVEYMTELEKENGQAFDPNWKTHESVSNSICSVVFGQSYFYEHRFLKLALDDNWHDLGGNAAVLNFMPWLRFHRGDMFHAKRLKKNTALIDDYVKNIYYQHVEDYNEMHITDFISAYIREMKKKKASDEPTTLNEENLVQMTGDLFGAGYHTTATTICWAIVFLLHHPQVQEKCFQEIEDKIGTDRPPTMQDKLSLPYLEATIMESQRLANVAPFAMLHSLSEDLVFHGYYIPKDAVIVPFMETVLLDEQIWGDPQVFRPERFLDESGKCVRPAEFIPFFLAGRHACLGESLAEMELFMYLSAMIQRFLLLPPEDGTLPSLQGTLGLIAAPEPFKVRAITRK